MKRRKALYAAAAAYADARAAYADARAAAAERAQINKPEGQS